MKNNNLLIFIIGAFLVGIVALVIVGINNGGNDPSAYSASALTVVESSFDFNTILMDAGDVSHNFEIRNEGEEAVKIEKVYTSCMCTSAYVIDSSGKRYGGFGMPGHGLLSKTNIDVGAGESITLEAIFDPAAHGPSGVGLARRSIYIETNSQKSPKLEVLFQATVTR